MLINALKHVALPASSSSVNALPNMLTITHVSSMNHTMPHPKLSHKDDPAGWSSLIGIITAICGNVLISIALNTQRYAHTKLSEQWERKRKLLRTANRRTGQASENGVGGQRGDRVPQSGGKRERRGGDVTNGAEDRDEVDETVPLLGRRSTSTGDDEYNGNREDEYMNSEELAQKSYLKSPYWWAGVSLMTLGEAGNFLAYGFAPASIVSPLGVVAIISNCIIAPFFMGEHFRFRDFLGVVVAVAGAVTVVLSASENNPKLGPHEIWDLITRWEFETYLGVTCLVIVLLMLASNKYGHKSIFIDLGLVGLFGGYTALSTKGVASLLSYTLFQALTFPITYLLVAVLVFTAVMQIKYVNRALQRFDATQVIPTQFVLFTLSVILGSAVLYRDFEKTPGEDAGKFVGGCAMTFIGVWLITSARPSPEDDEDSYIDEDDEAIILRPGEQYPNDSNVAVHGSDANLPSIIGFSEDESEAAQSPMAVRSPASATGVSLPESLERNHWGQSSTDTTTSSIATAPSRMASGRENVPPGLAINESSPVDENPWIGESQAIDPSEGRTLKSQPSSIQRLIASFFPDGERPNILPTTANEARHSAPDTSSTMGSSLASSAAQTPRITHNTDLMGSSLPVHVHEGTPTRLHHAVNTTLYPGAFPSPLSSSLSAMVTNSIRRSRVSGGSVSGQSTSGRRRSTRPRNLLNASTEAVAGTSEDLLSTRRNTMASERSYTTTTTNPTTGSYIDDGEVSDATTTPDNLVPGVSARRRTLRLGDRLGSLFSRARARISSNSSTPRREGSQSRNGGDRLGGDAV